MEWIVVPYTRYAVIRDEDYKRDKNINRACAFGLAEKEATNMASQLNISGEGLDIPPLKEDISDCFEFLTMSDV